MKTGKEDSNSFTEHLNGWIIIASEPNFRNNPCQFWESVRVISDRPTIVNRRLSGQEILNRLQVEKDMSVEEFSLLLWKHFQRNKEENFEIPGKVEKFFFDNDIRVRNPVEECAGTGRCFEIRKLFPRNGHLYKTNLEIIFKDYDSNSVSFFNCESAMSGEKSLFPIPFYVFKCANHTGLQLITHVEASKIILEPMKFEWLRNKVFPKFLKVAATPVDFREAKKSVPLQLIRAGDYARLYSSLKEKYGKEIVKIWPEVTDPSKFVYEDISIAAYLCLLWGGKRQKFIDLGCGNGLLVHILNGEGHEGYGVDVRSRKIWQLYPKSTILKVETVTPTSCYPHTDWLIGNHSDELTPWIPILAARNQFCCNFFLLPCCAYELNGAKFQRRDTKCSIYQNYLDYLGHTCSKMGWIFQKDTLKIPSTKRICFVSGGRKYQERAYSKALADLETVVRDECGLKRKWTARPAKERVRNGTSIKERVKDEIVKTVSGELISRQMRDTVEKGNAWLATLPLEVAVALIPKSTLAEMKRECGGLQTVLKNHHHIFAVIKGKVSFRIPTKKKGIFQTKPCWFFQNHPLGCPADECSFVHISSD